MRFSLQSPNLTFRKSFVAVRPEHTHTQAHIVAFSFCLLFNNNKISFQFQLKNSTRKLSQRSRLDNYLHIAAATAAAHQHQQQQQPQQQQQQRRSRPSCRKQKSATNCLTKTRKKTKIKKTLTRPKLKSKRNENFCLKTGKVLTQLR